MVKIARDKVHVRGTPGRPTNRWKDKLGTFGWYYEIMKKKTSIKLLNDKMHAVLICFGVNIN